MRSARIVFLVAGIYGLLVLTPMYFLEERIGREQLPAIGHPEFYYGFIGVGLAWQVLFLILAKDPVKYRTMMVPSMLEKVGYGAALIVLFMQHWVAMPIFAGGMVDWLFVVLFLLAYVKTPAA